MLYTGSKPFEQLEVRQKRRRREQVTAILETVSSHLSGIGLKMTKAQFESKTSYNEHFNIVVNEPAHENEEYNSESEVAAINYLMLKHGVPISFYHALTKRFKKLPHTYKVSKITYKIYSNCAP